MQGKIDSLNVSVTAGILIFEARKQRNFSWKFLWKTKTQIPNFNISDLEFGNLIL
jgi:hypothetical protein